MYTFVHICTLVYTYHTCVHYDVSFKPFHNALECLTVCICEKTDLCRDDVETRKISKSFRITAEFSRIEKNSLGSTRNLYQNLFQTILSNFGFFYFQVGGGVGHSPISIIDVTGLLPYMCTITVCPPVNGLL